MLAAGYALLMKIAEKLGIALVVKLVSHIDPMLILARTRYRRRLRTKLGEMPFLFRDMSLSASDDYVTLDLITLADGQFKPLPNTRPDFTGPMPKFESYRRAFVFGGGGYGKTTLFRNLAIRCLSTAPWRRILGKRGVIPLYLPLKVVKTSVNFPIMQAIQASDPYFAGKRGLNRIRKLGRAGKLLVLLDGYDEMPYSGGFDHVRRELEHLLARNSEYAKKDRLRVKTPFETSEFASCYEAIRESRVYLSSRLEFFEYNSIEADRDVQRWMVRGLEDRRIELVERIFSKYRSKSAASSGRDLNAELFLQEVSRAEDPGVAELSRSPLFLTVMCYVYAMDFGSDADSRVFSLNASELSRTCIRLLLEDLDEYKSREFSNTERRAIRNRRSSYSEEKYKFLCWFAVQLYELQISYFDEEAVSRLAKEYFSRLCMTAHAQEIERGLSSPDATCNIVRQIILSGLFVIVEKSGENRHLDFPHRTFREALAVEHFSTEGRVSTLLELLASKPYAELVLVFIDQSPDRSIVLKRLIDLVCSGRSPHVADLYVDALKRLPPSEAEICAIQLLDAMESCPGRTMPIGVLDFLAASESTLRYVRAKLLAALLSENPQLVTRWSTVSSVLRHPFVDDHYRLWKMGDASFQVLRALLFSGVLGGRFDSPVVDCFARAGLVNQNADEISSDIIEVFCIGQSQASRGALAAWADVRRASCQAGSAMCVTMSKVAISAADPEAPLRVEVRSSRAPPPAFY